MVIFSLLIAILIERSKRGPSHWTLTPFALSWQRALQRWPGDAEWARHPALKILLWLLPALVLGLLLLWQNSALLTLLVNLLVLLVCMGCPQQRILVRDYLAKAQHADCDGCDQTRYQLIELHPELAGHPVGSHLVWLNFRFYFAVALWFIIFGAGGALAYALCRSRALEMGEEDLLWSRVLYWVEWFPARVAGFAYLLIGHFSRALPIWLRGLTETEQPHAVYLSEVSQAAEDSSDGGEDLTDEPSVKLNLAKRTMVLLLAVTAVTTLLGWIS